MRMIIKQEDDSKQMAKKWSGRQAEEGTRGERQGGTKVEDDQKKKLEKGDKKEEEEEEEERQEAQEEEPKKKLSGRNGC